MRQIATTNQTKKANKVNNNHKLDGKNKTYRHTVITSLLKCKSALYLSIVSQGILEKNL